MFSDFNSASNALASVTVEGKKTATFQNLAGAVAEASGHLTEAETYFSEALRLQPTNQAVQLNLAMVYLHGTNVSAKPKARIILNRLTTNYSNPALRSMALRELMMDAEQNQQLAINKLFTIISY